MSDLDESIVAGGRPMAAAHVIAPIIGTGTVNYGRAGHEVEEKKADDSGLSDRDMMVQMWRGMQQLQSTVHPMQAKIEALERQLASSLPKTSAKRQSVGPYSSSPPAPAEYSASAAIPLPPVVGRPSLRRQSFGVPVSV